VGTKTIKLEVKDSGGLAGTTTRVVTVTPGVVVTVQPPTASVQVSQTQQFTATVSGTSNQAVTWAVVGGASNGTITTSGLYTAPGTVPSSATVTVRATSQADPSKSGTAQVTVAPVGPLCKVEPVQLDFETIAIGQSETKQFSIQNIGGGTLAGVASSPCAEFTIEGQASYSLAANATQMFSVRFAPASAGGATCHISAGNSFCSSVFCVGVGGAGSLCQVDPASLDFGSVTVGRTADLPFTIKNTGSGTLAGNVSESCASYSITVNGGSYSLTAGQERSVTVRFAPTTAGPDPCTVNLGGTVCGSLSCAGTGQQVIVTVQPPTASVQVGGTQQFTATVTGTANTAVTWSVDGGATNGMINSSGLYSGPATVPSPATVTVQATSQAEPSTSGTAQVTVTALPVPPPPLMVLIQPGQFLMGSPPSESGRETNEVRHQVTLTRAFSISNQEVRQSEWHAVMGWNDSDNIGPDLPVENVTWFDGVDFCNRKSQAEQISPAYTITGAVYTGSHITAATVTWDQNATGYRLPTEAEWEYCCRAGSATAFCNGPITNLDCSPLDPNLDQVGWYCGNVLGEWTHEVARKSPNGLGLSDMHGNVWEWVWDRYGGSYAGDAVTDPTGPDVGADRIIRGGGAGSALAQSCRSAYRFNPLPSERIGVGIRPCRTAEGQSPRCEVTPPSLDFGSVEVSQTKDLPFTIKNTGGGTLTGNVAESCPAYSLQSGGGSYSLTANQERTVAVRFAPTSAGLQTCTVDLGAAACALLGCSGTGTEQPLATGSCCASDNACAVTTQAACSGTWTAAGDCDPNPCQPIPPPEMVPITPGTFTMGSPTNELGRFHNEVEHRVTLTKAFYVSAYEVMQSEWQAVMGWNESSFPGPNHPVENVTWYDAANYCNQRSTREGFTPTYVLAAATYDGNHVTSATVTWNQAANGYRLLTEAEWEYACRATSTTAFYNGGITNIECDPLDPALDQVGWYCGNSSGTTHDVGGKMANAWGLNDMHGNVMEWCWDWWGGGGTAGTDPVGPSSGSDKVIRGGGSWPSGAQDCRSATRTAIDPNYRLLKCVGLRLARTVP
jgi:formylglycine-generating enzyme required for sulfatase activity